jgi:hypothetical protein
MLDSEAYEEGHKMRWDEAKVLQIEPNTTNRKYKESAHMSLLDHPISQPSVDISPIRTRHHSRSQETTAPSSVIGVGNYLFHVLVPQGPGMTSF